MATDENETEHDWCCAELGMQVDGIQQQHARDSWIDLRELVVPYVLSKHS